MSNISVMVVGVGGQGTLLTSRVLGDVALNQNYDVKASEVHGMAQRGGSVVTYIKFGEKVYSPLIEKGEADFIIAFEELEALRWSDYLKKDGRIIVNTMKVNPLSVNNGKEEYPKNVVEKLRSKHNNVIALDALGLAKEAGHFRAVNIVLLGVLSKFLGIDNDTWLESIKNTVPQKTIEINTRAFKMGAEYTIK